MKTTRKNLNFMIGLMLTLFISLTAKALSLLPGLMIIGPLVLALLLGMVVRSLFQVKKKYAVGVDFSSKYLLRLGIILLGLRLHLGDIYHAGLTVFMLALICLLLGILGVYGLSRLFGVGKKIGLLTAFGTGICGAAAIVALAPQLKANKEEVSTSVAVIAVLGTFFTIVYTFIYSILQLTPIEYGQFVGATLHEIAHVIAASDIGGSNAVDMAIIVKLTRVMLLIPVAFVLGLLIRSKAATNEGEKASLPMPWFIIGFLAMSGLNTLDVLPEMVVHVLVNSSAIFLAMAMAGFGLNVNIKNLLQRGKSAFIAGLIGSVVLSMLGYFLVRFFAN
ncbi:YeiH family protein [Bacillus sp. PS06]|uniref:YeiH family protein n=1 Tax=Bacillus sp. PS06 TaxID=2764176 RepID=UPI001786BDB0|nr:YeiH family protein [Bacillus sp. PS06]MBD8068529.1 YeiH family putative sulfate export transporter [Bacillus sp. PS06]